MFQEGTPRVSRTGLAFVHRDEAIIPARNNPFLQRNQAAQPMGGKIFNVTFNNHFPEGVNAETVASRTMFQFKTLNL